MSIVNLQNPEEEVLWKETLIAYLNRGGSHTQGAHLKFADRIVFGLRRRLVKKKQEQQQMELSIPGLNRYCPTSMLMGTFYQIVQDAVKRSTTKIQAIKLLRAKTGLGLRDSKEAVEFTYAVHPNPNWY